MAKPQKKFDIPVVEKRHHVTPRQVTQFDAPAAVVEAPEPVIEKPAPAVEAPPGVKKFRALSYVGAFAPGDECSFSPEDEEKLLASGAIEPW